jgi:hypothetical protein
MFQARDESIVIYVMVTLPPNSARHPTDARFARYRRVSAKVVLPTGRSFGRLTPPNRGESFEA